MDVYVHLKELGLELPPLPPKGGIYKPVVQVGNLLYISGQGATVAGVPKIVGYVGDDLTLEEGQEAAKLCGLNALSTLHSYLGDLNRVKRLVKTMAWVSSAHGFQAQPKVIDGCSGMMRDIFGEDGIGARSAIGTNELPGGIACEIEFIFEIYES